LSARGRLGKSGPPNFYFWTPLISSKLIELESLILIYWQAFAGTRATCKNLSARGRLGRSAAPIFLFWDPLHISVTNGARKLIWQTYRHLRVLAPGIKNLSARGRLGKSGVPTFILGPPHRPISETNRARKLKFGMLIGICRYYGNM